MEKFEYYLSGRHFDLITDHKEIVEINKNPEFGSRRIQRWFERISRFQFTVKYKEGKKMLLSDAISRSMENKEAYENDSGCEEGYPLNTIERRESKENCKQIIMKVHEELSHRKNIFEVLEPRIPALTKNSLRN